jgi:hypothetical protein
MSDLFFYLLVVNMILNHHRGQGLSAGSLGFAGEIGKTTDEWRVGVGRRLGPRVVGAVVRVRVALVGPTDDGASEHVGVGGAGVVVALEPLLHPMRAGWLATDGRDEPRWWIRRGHRAP